MRDIYLIDFENVASEGLSGITYLSPEDQVIIFYSANSNRLSMKMHILIGKSTCNLNYFEVSVGGKNALDHQISTWLGYLIGTGAAERSYYIVSRDMGYRHVANFWAVNDGKPRVKCVETIRAAVRLERIRQEKEAANEPVQETAIETAAEGTSETATPVKTSEVPVPVPTPVILRAVTEPVLELKAAEVKVEAPVQPMEQTEAPAEQPPSRNPWNPWRIRSPAAIVRAIVAVPGSAGIAARAISIQVAESVSLRRSSPLWPRKSRNLSRKFPPSPSSRKSLPPPSAIARAFGRSPSLLSRNPKSPRKPSL